MNNKIKKEIDFLYDYKEYFVKLPKINKQDIKFELKTTKKIPEQYIIDYRKINKYKKIYDLNENLKGFDYRIQPSYLLHSDVDNYPKLLDDLSGNKLERYQLYNFAFNNMYKKKVLTFGSITNISSMSNNDTIIEHPLNKIINGIRKKYNPTLNEKDIYINFRDSKIINDRNNFTEKNIKKKDITYVTNGRKNPYYTHFGDLCNYNDISNFNTHLKNNNYKIDNMYILTTPFYHNDRKSIRENIFIFQMLNSIIVTLLNMNKEGNLILFTHIISNKTSIDYLYLLSNFFEDVYLYKDQGSLKSSFMLYIICNNFRGLNEDDNKKILDLLNNINKIDHDCGYKLYPSIKSNIINYNIQLNKNNNQIKKDIFLSNLLNIKMNNYIKTEWFNTLKSFYKKYYNYYNKWMIFVSKVYNKIKPDELIKYQLNYCLEFCINNKLPIKKIYDKSIINILNNYNIKNELKSNYDNDFLYNYIIKNKPKKILIVGINYGLELLFIIEALKKIKLKPEIYINDYYQKIIWNNNGIKLLKENNYIKYITKITYKENSLFLPLLLNNKKESYFDLIFTSSFISNDSILIDIYYNIKLLNNNINSSIIYQDTLYNGKTNINNILFNYKNLELQENNKLDFLNILKKKEIGQNM